MEFGKSAKKEGFSLVELIVVIAIIALMVGIASLSVGLLRGTDTRGLASKINDSLMDLKSMTLAHRGPYYMYIYKDDDSYCAGFTTVELDPSESVDSSKFTNYTRLGSSTMTITTDKGDMSDGDCLEFTIQKKDGSYRSTSNGASTDPPKYIQVKKSSSGSPDYTVVVAKNTGLHYVYQGEYPTTSGD